MRNGQLYPPEAVDSQFPQGDEDWLKQMKADALAFYSGTSWPDGAGPKDAKVTPTGASELGVQLEPNRPYPPTPREGLSAGIEDPIVWLVFIPLIGVGLAALTIAAIAWL